MLGWVVIILVIPVFVFMFYLGYHKDHTRLAKVREKTKRIKERRIKK